MSMREGMVVLFSLVVGFVMEILSLLGLSVEPGVFLSLMLFFFSSRRRHTRYWRDWSQTCALPILSDFLKTQPPEEAAVLAWPVVCGADVAARTKALSFNEGQLTIEVPDANWRNQLSAFIPRYLSGLNDLVGPVVKEIRFQLQGQVPRIKSPG